MNVRLVLERNRKRIWTVQLSRPESTLGRAVGCTIRIPSAEVSRLHCRLCVKDGIVLVEDLESVNGTFLNGQRIRDREIVRPGDRLSLGSLTFVVEYRLSEEAQRRLSGEIDYEVLAADDDTQPAEDAPEPTAPLLELEAVEEAPPQSTTSLIPVVEPVQEVEEVNSEVPVLSEDEEIHLPERGELRDFLIELDDTDDSSKKPKH
jgi:pSer/pThr/pTyr-binding forkhead associated (FHA) protein